MKTKISLALFILCLLALAGFGQAFNLVESIPLRADERQEARIDGQWLLANTGNGTLVGYIVLPEKDGGKIEVFYSGDDYFDGYHYVNTELEIDNVYAGPYGWHFTGIAPVFGVKLSNGTESVLSDVGVVGFYNSTTEQIYLSFQHKELGMTWVTFFNDPFTITDKSGK